MLDYIKLEGDKATKAEAKLAKLIKEKTGLDITVKLESFEFVKGNKNAKVDLVGAAYVSNEDLNKILKEMGL